MIRRSILIGSCIFWALAMCGCAGPRAYRHPGSEAQTSSSFTSASNFIPALRPQPVPQAPSPVYHIVLPKETLYRISKMYAVPIQAIMNANQLTDPTKISVGQTLVIPGTGEYRPSIPLFENTGRWTHIIIHHTASDYGDAQTIDRWHQRRGWKNGLGYHFIIDNGTMGHRDGEVEIGSRWYKQMRGAHVGVGNWNEYSIGVAIVGNLSKNDMTERQLKSLLYVAGVLSRQYGIPASRILGHRDVPGAATECPGRRFLLTKFLAELEC